MNSAAIMIQDMQRHSGLTQAELARRTGMTRSVINAYARGKREPGATALCRIAAAAGFDLSLSERKPPVDPVEAGHRLAMVLGLAQALPFRPKPDLMYPKLPGAH